LCGLVLSTWVRTDRRPLFDFEWVCSIATIVTIETIVIKMTH